MKTAATPMAAAARARTGTNSRLAAAVVALAAGLLHRMRGIEHHGKAGLGQYRQPAHVGDHVFVAEAGAALAQQDVCRLPAWLTLAATCFMSQGARNWPFLMLMARPVAAAASRRSVWRQRKAGICSTVDGLGHRGALLGGMDVGQHRAAEALAQLGQDGQPLAIADAARAGSGWCDWPLSNEVL